MNEQTGMFLIGYIGLLLPAIVGFVWVVFKPYSQKRITRHWPYVMALLAIMAIMTFFFRGESFKTCFLVSLLPVLACAIGAIPGGVFSYFFHQNYQRENKVS